jgi:replication initiation and membrane attachment protein DnaB
MKIMEWIGPAMTLFIMFQVPALIGIYWLFRSLLAILKQYILKVAMPVPQYTEEELREMEKAEKEIQKAQKEAAKAQNKHRSLHYIDDDDYEILPDAPQSEEKKNTKLIDGEIPEIKD